ncbi:MAG: hypothetical protein U1F43_36565 [Myxococcota bacterium]
MGKGYAEQAQLLAPDGGAPVQRKPKPPGAARGQDDEGGGAAGCGDLGARVEALEADNADAKHQREKEALERATSSLALARANWRAAEGSFNAVEEFVEEALVNDNATAGAEAEYGKARKAYQTSKAPDVLQIIGNLIDIASGIKEFVTSGVGLIKAMQNRGGGAAMAVAKTVVHGVGGASGAKYVATGSSALRDAASDRSADPTDEMVAKLGGAVGLIKQQVVLAQTFVVGEVQRNIVLHFETASAEMATALRELPRMDPHDPQWDSTVSNASDALDMLESGASDFINRMTVLRALNHARAGGGAAGLERGTATRGIFAELSTNPALCASATLVIQSRLEVHGSNEEIRPYRYSLEIPDPELRARWSRSLASVSPQGMVDRAMSTDADAITLPPTLGAAVASLSLGTIIRMPEVEAHVVGKQSQETLPIAEFRRDEERVFQRVDGVSGVEGAMSAP